MTVTAVTTDTLQTPGVKLSREFAGMAHDPERDAYSKAARVGAWDNLEAQHERARWMRSKGKAPPIPYDHVNFLISGDKGIGKTAVACSLALLNYSQGQLVFSTASFLFGYRIDALDIFTMAETLPNNCVVFIDEAHSVADRYSENSARNRTLAASVALLRKKGIRLIFASVHEHAVAMTIKSEVDTLVYPHEMKKPAGAPYPSWCWVKTYLIGPQPFRGRREADRWNIARFGGDVKRRTRPMPPSLMWEACKLMDTFAMPDIAAGLMTSADDVRTRLGQRGQVQEGEYNFEERSSDFMLALVAILKREGSKTGWIAVRGAKGTDFHVASIINRLKVAGYDFTEKEVRDFCNTYFNMSARGRITQAAFTDRFNVDWGDS